jgi:hypothetical protein
MPLTPDELEHSETLVVGDDRFTSDQAGSHPAAYRTDEMREEHICGKC